MNFNFDVIIIGAGVSSSAIARELSGYKSSICVLNALIEESNLTIPQVWR